MAVQPVAAAAAPEREDAGRGGKCLLYRISVVHIHIHIQHAPAGGQMGDGWVCG